MSAVTKKKLMPGVERGEDRRGIADLPEAERADRQTGATEREAVGGTGQARPAGAMDVGTH